MLRKSVVLSALFLSVILVSIPTWAQCPTPDGYYLLDGKLTAKASSPSLVTLSLNLLNLGAIQASALFDSSTIPGGFSLTVPLLSADPLLSGSWAMDAGRCTFAVTGILQSLIDELAQSGIEATITSESFTGTVGSDGTIKGKFNLGVTISAFLFVTGKVSIKGSFTGVPAPEPPISPPSAGVSALDLPGQGGSKAPSFLAELILKLLKKVPVQ